MDEGTRVKAVCRGGPADGDEIEVGTSNGWPDLFVGRSGGNYIHRGPIPPGAPTVYVWVPLNGEPSDDLAD